MLRAPEWGLLALLLVPFSHSPFAPFSGPQWANLQDSEPYIRPYGAEPRLTARSVTHHVCASTHMHCIQCRVEGGRGGPHLSGFHT